MGWSTLLAGLLFGGNLLAASAVPSAFVDDQGVMRWSESGDEIALFGVNYTTPFAHAFRAHQRLGVDWRDAIDADVYHLARLGFDAYRVHVWDREITDMEGNLVVNEHVEAFDYLLAKLKERGFKIILTPLQFGNAGYPEPGVPLQGYSSAYGKRGSLEDPTSWPMQERYLAQFASHVNPHTGVAYKDDPDIIAFEICNEPGHWDYASALEYINRMVGALRGVGLEAPIFYNMSHGLPVFDAYLDADVQGGTFQWYPASLLAGHEQHGNFLPYVDRYPIPFADDSRFQSKAKMVYEFDAADIGRSYIYPAIARTYRTAGMQFATQFAYDPMHIAPVNTEYQTHYFNLAYAPSKSLGMMVAGEAFRRVPLGNEYGSHPDNTSFAGVRVSYEDDLAELVTDETFIHSNSTTTDPPNPEQLTTIAGFGYSPVVSYPGRGAYFLDRLESGVWRLEVMPDAIWVRDPFEKASPHKQVSRIAWRTWPMELRIPDLGPDFAIVGLNNGNDTNETAAAGVMTVGPGTYLLTRDGVTTSWTGEKRWRNLTLGEFMAPSESIDRAYVLHQPPAEASAGRDLPISASVVAPETVDEVRLIYYPAETFASTGEGAPPARRPQPGRFNQAGVGTWDTGGAKELRMEADSGIDFSVAIPAADMQKGNLRYHIAIRTGELWTAFPSGTPAYPVDWDFHGEPWTVQVRPPTSPVVLFEAARDASAITANRRDVRYDLVPSDHPGLLAMEMVATDLERPEHDHSFRHFFRDQIASRRGDFEPTGKLVLYGRSWEDVPTRVQLALVSSDGFAYGAMLAVEPGFGAYAVAVDDLRPVRMPNIPHGYPVFIPFWSDPSSDIPLDLNRVESVQVSIGPGMTDAELDQPQGVLIERIWLER